MKQVEDAIPPPHNRPAQAQECESSAQFNNSLHNSPHPPHTVSPLRYKTVALPSRIKCLILGRQLLSFPF